MTDILDEGSSDSGEEGDGSDDDDDEDNEDENEEEEGETSLVGFLLKTVFWLIASHILGFIFTLQNIVPFVCFACAVVLNVKQCS